MQHTTLLNIRDVADRLRVQRGTIYRLLSRDATFPKPVYIAPKVPRWRSDELAAYIDRMSAARETAAA